MPFRSCHSPVWVWIAMLSFHSLRGRKELDRSEIREAYRYLHKLFTYEEVDREKLPVPVFVEGFFGAGKTEAILRVAWLIDRRRTVDKILILAFPLRELRDDKYQRLVETGVRPFIFRAHDEVCEDLRLCLLKRREERRGRLTRTDYYKCLEQHLKEGNCKYKQHIEELKEYVRSGGRVIVATHLMGRVAKLIYQDAKLVVDEAEDFLLKLSEPIPKRELDVFTDKKMRSMIRKYFTLVEDSWGRKYYVINQSGLVSLFARDVVYVSATIPPSFKEYFAQIASILHRRKEKKKKGRGRKKKVPPPLDYQEYPVNSHPDRDTVLILDEVLYWNHKDEWYPEIMGELLKVAKLAVKKYKVLGVVSKNKKMTADLVELFRSAGFSVWADTMYDPYRSRDVYTRADIVIITTRGYLYRGRSVFSLKRIEMCKEKCNEKCNNVKDNDERVKCYEDCYSNCQKDFPVIVAFYQAKRDIIHPTLADTLIKLGGQGLYRDFRTELLHARNLQALYRFNRERDKEHIMVLLDERFAEAYKTYYKRRFTKEMKRLWIRDRSKIYEVFSAIIPN